MAYLHKRAFVGSYSFPYHSLKSWMGYLICLKNILFIDFGTVAIMKILHSIKLPNKISIAFVNLWDKYRLGHSSVMAMAVVQKAFLIDHTGWHLTLKAPITTIVICFLICLWFYKSFLQIVDPDQTAPLGAVWSGSTLFACMQK